MKRDEALRRLGDYTVALLAKVEEWGADELDAIAAYAIDLKLAHLDKKDGMFRRTPEKKTKKGTK